MHLCQTLMTSTLLALCMWTTAPVAAAETDSKVEPANTSTTPSTKSALPYQRLDFQVKASCVTCLRKVAKALKATRGVVSADVSIYYPHWAVVIIDTAMTDEKKIVARVAKEKAAIDKMIKQDLKDKPILVVPRSDVPARL